MMTKEQAATFFRTWLELLDTGAPPATFFKYLTDGEFEEWSYPGVKIANRQQLEAYFTSAWGSIREQHSAVEALDVTDLGDGTFTVHARVQWEAVTQKGKVSSPLSFTVTVGSGTSALDPEGEHPKVLRYRMERLQAGAG